MELFDGGAGGQSSQVRTLESLFVVSFITEIVFCFPFICDVGFDLVDVDPTRGDKDTLLGKGLNLLATGVVMLRVTHLSTLAYCFFWLGLVLVFIDDHALELKFLFRRNLLLTFRKVKVMFTE